MKTSGTAGGRETAGGRLVLPGIAGRRALVTGGSRGIGRAVALLLGEAGATVGIGYRTDRSAAEATLAELGAQAARLGRPGGWAEAADLSTTDGVAQLFRRLDEEFGGTLDVFVGNAGVWNPAHRPVSEIEPDEWRRVLDANVTSAYLCAREAIRRMESGGSVILISSTAAQRGEAGHADYAASKGALQSFVKSLAVEVGPLGITVNAVAPGWVDTDMTASVLRGAERDRIRDEIPVRRIGTPADVAGPVAFLASDLARHVTGEVLNVNGGSVLCG